MATDKSPDAPHLNGLKTAMNSAFTNVETCWENSGQPMGGDPLVYFTAKKLETLQQYDYLKLNERISLDDLVITKNNIKQLSKNIKGMFEEFLNHNICKENIEALNKHYDELQEYVQEEIERFRSPSPNSTRGGRRLRKSRRSNRKTRSSRRSKKTSRHSMRMRMRMRMR
jgi:hypothetical protein